MKTFKIIYDVQKTPLVNKNKYYEVLEETVTTYIIRNDLDNVVNVLKRDCIVDTRKYGWKKNFDIIKGFIFPTFAFKKERKYFLIAIGFICFVWEFEYVFKQTN